MMNVRLPVFSITCFFSYVFVSIFLVNTLASLPFPLPHQIEILLAFKNEFPSPTCSHTVLSSWTRNTPQNTISFDGVVFDNETGAVTELHLDGACLRGTMNPNSNLFKLHHLRYLDLSYNDLDFSSFPAKFESLANLEVLKFRCSGLVGEVPPSIHNLSHLTFLDLSDNELSGSFPLVYNLTKLSFLDLSYNNYYGTIPSSLFTMPSLLNLNLRQNHLRDPLQNLNSSSSSKLQSLYLGENFFSGRILEPISKLVKLTYLDLSFLNIIYPINIVFLPLKSLEYLDLSGNFMSRLNTSSDQALTKLIGLDLSYCNIFEFPKFLMTLQSLEYLDLSGNSISRLNTSSDHSLTKLIGLNLSNCNILEFPKFLLTLQSLEYLDLSGNSLSRLNTSSDDGLTKLVGLYLSNNNIVEFPKILKTLPNLQQLDISNNRLRGEVPEWLWNLPLTDVSLSHNSLHGFEGLPEVLLNSSLEMLDLRSNAFQGPLPILPPTIEFLVASNNNFTGDLALSLCNARKLRVLDLSNNNFTGPIPPCLANSSLEMLYLRSNAFGGPLPNLPPTIEFLVASNNNFTGELALSLCNPMKLSLLDLSHNSFSGPIPPCLGHSVLVIMDLSHNNLDGEIPDTYCRSGTITTIDVGHNQITGKLPRSLINCTGLEILNVESNHIIDTFPFWLKTLPNLKLIVLRSNRFHGPISSPNDQLSFPQLRTIDISLNDFNGSLPPNYFVDWINMREANQFTKYPNYFGLHNKLPNYFMRHKGTRKHTSLLDIEGPWYFSMELRVRGETRELERFLEMYTIIDFSGNRLEGKIPESIGLLKSLIALNLSHNSLTGHIPSSLTKLTDLESLDLSRNQLSEEIPQELATLTFLSYINMSHNKLRGEIPQSTQFKGQTKSSFEGNVDLCGLPLEESCTGKNGEPSPRRHQLKPSKSTRIDYRPTLMMIGLGIGHIIGVY